MATSFMLLRNDSNNNDGSKYNIIVDLYIIVIVILWWLQHSLQTSSSWNINFQIIFCKFIMNFKTLSLIYFLDQATKEEMFILATEFSLNLIF